MSAGFRMDDYVDVAQRIHDFYERFPEGSLQSGCAPYVMEIAGKPFVVYHALAYRTPDDPLPSHGWAWEPVPGPSSFTKDSELMNAETSAWGRAIVALGFATKKLASAQEVRNRQPEPAKAAPKTAEKEKTAETPTDELVKTHDQLAKDWGALMPEFPVADSIAKRNEKRAEAVKAGDAARYRTWLLNQIDGFQSMIAAFKLQSEAEAKFPIPAGAKQEAA